eukprot:TRINITY_DN23586_c0_g1_i1.p1 TRINITY_DN23586_c0_g1~~TRINITY_DN23586_c0_g1_i1.p1  ORF type:complete len:451 (+),score=111.72 TRINITY_DN23586_c0_g1_i1:171-1523(+)
MAFVTQAQLARFNGDMNIFFLECNALIIFFMQAGFAFLEAGSVRSKNTTTILLKNCMDAFGGALIFWALGYAFAFGGDSPNEFIGDGQFFLINTDAREYAFVFFQYTFAATSVTIISGAMAERTTFVAYFLYSLLITGFIYPVVAHWTFSGQGWLTLQLNYADFAGSGVVHITGGIAGLIGTIFLGPRIGRYDAETGKPQGIPGHSTVLTTLGFFILWFGFHAFNAGSVITVAGGAGAAQASRALINTTLASAAGALTVLFITKFEILKEQVTICRLTVTIIHPLGSHWCLTAMLNGSLAGMVSICAGANVVEPWAAMVIGIIAGIAYSTTSSLLEMMHIDDPLNACPVHLFGGIWGVLSVALFAPAGRLPFATDGGVLYAWDRHAFVQLGNQALGATCIMAWVLVCTTPVFLLLHLGGHLRVSPEAEEDGLDFIEGEPAYPIDLAVFAE